VIVLCVEHGLTNLLAMETIFRGWAMAKQGRNDEGIALIHERLAASRARGTQLLVTTCLSLLAEACLEEDRLDHGLCALAAAAET
jgi:hypothetical protein